MADLRLEREFDADPEIVFAYMTVPGHLLEWWGHDGMTIPAQSLDFTRPGPWFAVLCTDEGNLMRMSGEVTAVDPPRSVSFTWAWHDAAGERGHESRVRFDLEPAGAGTRLVLTHEGLPDDDASALHARGWAGTLARLERRMARIDIDT